MRLSTKDTARDLTHRRDVVSHQTEALVLQRLHALCCGLAVDLLLSGPADDESADLGSYSKKFEDPNAIAEARASAEVAAFAPVELGLRRAAHVPVEAQLVLGRLVGGTAREADAPHEPLRNDR